MCIEVSFATIDVDEFSFDDDLRRPTGYDLVVSLSLTGVLSFAMSLEIVFSFKAAPDSLLMDLSDPKVICLTLGVAYGLGKVTPMFTISCSIFGLGYNIRLDLS